MNRSVYSLVLMDDVVEKIDELAYSMRTSRSNLINQILAQYVSCDTPEQRMKDIFSRMETLLEPLDVFRIQPQPSESMLSVISPLRFKYNPTLKYSVELYRDAKRSTGLLKVTSRSQSQPLLDALGSFFELWARLEAKYIGKYFPEKAILYIIESGRYTRELRALKGEKSEAVADAISRYISAFDAVMKKYFALMGNELQLQVCEQLYASLIAKMEVII